MGTQQRESGLPGVIEGPQGPTVARMTVLALAAQAAVVDVVMGMTIRAAQRGAVKGHARMALCATDQPMHAKQREAAQIVIKCEIGSPSGLSVAGFATTGELRRVRIGGPVATRAVSRQLLGCDRRRMAGLTVDFGVHADECKLGALCMIVGDRLPPAVAVAVIAAGTQTGRVCVIRTMATIAVFRNEFLVIAAAVTGETVKIGMRSQQRIAGLLQVIVLCVLPLRGVVALGALAAALAAVHVVSLVAS